MGSAVNFEDTFAEAEDVLPPAFAKDHYVRANVRAEAQQAHPSSQSTLTPSFLFTLSIATIVFVAVYWVYSFWTDLRRRQREAFFQLEHRRRHGIPDDDKRPWHEAYPAALERRRPLLRRPIVKEDTKPAAQYDAAYDPYGRTIKDHFILEENARVERRNVKELEEAIRLGSPTKDGFYPGPLTIARSSVVPDASAKGEGVSRSPLKRVPSPYKLDVLSLSNGVQSGSHSQLPVPSHTYSGSQGAPKANGRKRLYMDPRGDESGKAQSGGEETDDDRATALSLPKRQRVNTWGVDSRANGTKIPRIEKRPADVGNESAATKRQRQSLSTMQGQVTARPQNKSLTASLNGAVPIGRLKVKPTVTFAPTPRGSSSASSSVPPHAPNGQLPSEALAATASAARGQKREYEDLESVNGADSQENASVSKTADAGQPARKRGRETTVGTPQAKPTGKVLPQIQENDGSEVAVDPLCIGHKPGEVWESGNMRFKVGPDGRRLRAGNVKERRPKYHMPTDSAHQDHSATIEVVVEKWFTEQEYTSAKAAGEFAWQDEPSVTPAAKLEPSRRKAGRSSASFWDVPDSTHTSPSDSGSEVNPFALGSSGGRLGPVRARSSFGSPAPVPAGGRRATSTRWQKQQAEAEALKRIQEAKIAQEKAKAQPSGAAAPSTTPSINPPVGVSFPVPSFNSTTSSQTKESIKPSGFAANDEKAGDKKDSAPKPNPFAGIGISSPVPSIAPSTAANPIGVFPASSAATASAPKPFSLPINSPTPPLLSGISSAQPKPTENTSATPSPFSFSSFGAPKINGNAAPAPNPFASQPTMSVPHKNTDAVLPTASLARAAPSPFAFGSNVKPTEAISTPPPPPVTSSFGTSGFSFGGATKPPEPAIPAPAVPSFGSGKGPSGFSFGPDIKRTESTSTAVSPAASADASQLSSATTLVGSATTPTTGFAPPESKEQSKQSLEPAKTGHGPSLLDRLGPQPPATQAATAPSSFSAFSAPSVAPVSVFGASNPPTSAALPNPFAKPAAFGPKPEEPSQSSLGISLKGAANAFGAPTTSNGTTNGASGGFNFNKSWTNPDLAKKQDSQPSGGNVFGAGASKPNIFQTGPTEPATMGVGATTAHATPKPPSVFGSSVFGTQPTPFGASPTAAASASAGGAPTPDKWVPPSPSSSSFSPQGPLFPAHRPTGAPQANARARSRSSRPPTRPPR